MDNVKTIELGGAESANPGQCGSCKYFQRRDNHDGMGVCTFRLPPWSLMKTWNKADDSDPRTLVDTDGCDLWKAKERDRGEPIQFVQKRYWLAGEPPR